MSAAFDQFQEKATKYDYIRFCWADLHGISRNKIVPARNLAKFWKSGVCAYAGVQCVGPRVQLTLLDQIVKLGHPNCKVIPDTDTLHTVAWSGGDKYSVGQVLCQTHWCEDGRVMEACTRHMAKKQLAHLTKIGFTILSATEMEFCIFDKKTKAPVFDGGEALNTAVLAENESIIYDMDDLLFKSGVNIETLQTDHGPGQFELVLSPKLGIKAADNVFIFKNATREICSQRGLQISFMSKPTPHSSASGCHYNHSLWDASGKSVFYDPESEDGFSATAKHWMAGLIKHAAALTALCNPTVNCYRRLHTQFAPNKANWAVDDRFTAFRTKAYGPNSTYIENRLPSSASNPYLVLAATIAAGLDGVEKKLECPPPKDPSAQKLPSSLQEALEALKADTDMISALGTEFLEWFVTEKQEVELKKLGHCDIKKDWTKDFVLEQEMYSLYI